MTDADASELWLEAAQQVLAGDEVDVMCPEKGDGVVRADWIPGTGSEPAGRGEYRLWCPACGAENFALVAERKGS